MLRRIFAAFAMVWAAVGSTYAQPLPPQRTFVASYGLDANPCSLPAPCRTFQAAINAVASSGEVVAIDSAGYGAMEIRKSVSVIVPAGIHAGLSPSTGIPLPGYPGEYGVVLIDIQNTDVVVLRGLNINHQGTVTGGIEWISPNGGTVQIENAVINGFPKEGIYMQAPSGKLFVKDSVLRNVGVGVYIAIAGGSQFDYPHHHGIFADHLRIENSGTGIKIHDKVGARFSNCEIASNAVGLYILGAAEIYLDRCSLYGNQSLHSIEGIAGLAILNFSASFIFRNGNGSRAGTTYIGSHGNNATDYSNAFFDSVLPPQ